MFTKGEEDEKIYGHGDGSSVCMLHEHGSGGRHDGYYLHRPDGGYRVGHCRTVCGFSGKTVQ